MNRPSPALGATWLGDRTMFRVWAPEAGEVTLLAMENGGAPTAYPMTRDSDGYFSIECTAVRPGMLYRYRVDGHGPFPDPASRYQPMGVHEPSQVVDPSVFRWTDADWRGIPQRELVLYEAHVGTCTLEGTFAALRSRLPALQDLGVTAIELMPIADFPGNRNWGYDGVAPFAPARCYGVPDDLRRLVDEAHRLGLAVYLDVVYNHFGPDGAYQGCFSRHYFSTAHASPWGAALNFDGPESGPVRAYVIENAVRWIHEYHLDGLRLDATQAIVDTSPRHILAELVDVVHAMAIRENRSIHLIAEDARNLDCLVRGRAAGGYGLDGVWSDDVHHQARVALTGDRDGYFRDFSGTAADVARTVRQGWFYTGQRSAHFGGPRGTEPTGIPYGRFVAFIQNHDQVGNRAFGDRLHHAIDPATYRAVSTLLMLSPETPLLFMGQEWAATAPFLYFTDHTEELGRAVTQGRREEFQGFVAFADPVMRATIPDPQDPETFRASRLEWREREGEPHASVLRLYRALLAVRRQEPALQCEKRSGEAEAMAWGDDVVLLRRDCGDAAVLGIVRLRGAGQVDLRGCALARHAPDSSWAVVVSTEDPDFASDSAAIAFEADGPLVDFARSGALVLALRPSAA